MFEFLRHRHAHKEILTPRDICKQTGLHTTVDLNSFICKWPDFANKLNPSRNVANASTTPSTTGSCIQYLLSSSLPAEFRTDRGKIRRAFSLCFDDSPRGSGKLFLGRPEIPSVFPLTCPLLMAGVSVAGMFLRKVRKMEERAKA